MVQVSIIIPTYKDWHRLELCLKALADQSFSQNAFEIIVVNNYAHDTVPAGFFTPGNCTIITETNHGSYAARNAALKIAKGDILGFTDSDCVPDKDWIKNAVAYFTTHADITRIGGPLHIFFKGKGPTFTELFDMKYAFPQESYAKSGFAVTGNLFVKRVVFNTIGPFDETVESGGDYLWGQKAEAAGLKIAYSADVAVNHPARDSIKELYKKEKRVGKGQASFLPYQPGPKLTTFLNYLRHFKPNWIYVNDIWHNTPGTTKVQRLWLIHLQHFLAMVRYHHRLKHQIKKSNKK
ncbi:glycosyltransferase [Mucilaginibacter terrae]|uniref:Cellulose synthase/poly-beta-1,6-N-acetylglucosamine synthase-like glycosyltransferase n=1 Tax=Mucilaginibacter terrae TaxID=1955052 RepID=A0ABU3GYC5_9SPHI|nr:glycosyltransferase family A protein [Mucilaginibacter terrae]MDT3404777.1 cellulose synthase/poly-beta-1,6-N-acetylglucosamine synthase-like glycosyltransferase [Mucilaginibacter terrae]